MLCECFYKGTERQSQMSVVYKQTESRNYNSNQIHLWIDHVYEQVKQAQETRNKAVRNLDPNLSTNPDLEAADIKVAQLTELLFDLRDDLTTKQKQEKAGNGNSKARIKALIVELSNIIDSM